MGRGSKMKNAVLISFFESENIGDIILSEKLFEEFTKKARINKIDFVTGKCKRKFKCSIDGNPYIKKINKINKINKIKNKLKSIGLVKEIVDYKNSIKCIRAIDWVSVEKEIVKSDILIIGGGNMLMGLSYDFPFIFKKYVEIAKKHNKDISVVSVGVGPFKNKLTKTIIKRSLKDVKHITTRDKRSKELLIDITKNKEINVACDPAMLCENKTRDENKTQIAFSVYPYQESSLNIDGNDYKYEAYINELADLVNETYIKFQREIILFSTEKNDYKAVEHLYSKVHPDIKNSVTIRYVDCLNDIINVYNDTLVLIGTRLHSMIIAYTQLVPIIGLSWQPKVDGFFEYIDRGDYNFNIKDIKKERENILNKCDICIKNYNSQVNDIVNKKKDISKDFNINFKYIDRD